MSILRPYIFLTFLLAYVLSPDKVSAQLTVTTGQTAQDLAEIIAGAGVTVSNASIIGSPDAIGAFVKGGNPTNLGLQSGVVISSGDVQDIAQPEFSFASTNHNNTGNLFLTNQSGVQSYDAVTLQFDFVPNADLVQFNYVFGSEEYPGFVCQNFNDMFAFTVTGVSVVHPEVNIALIPGTSTPVSINSVNNQGCGTPAYYISNSGDQVVAFGGVTVTMTAEANVLCGETYTLRLMIADGFDGIYDSGCFIQENSLTTGNISVETSTATGDNTVYEGCLEGTVVLTVNGPPVQQDVPVPIWIADATAIEGVDFEPLTVFNADSTVIIPAGQTSVSFTVTAINDNIPEPLEYITFVYISSTCGSTDTFQIFLSDLVPLSVITSNDTTLCQGQGSATLSADGFGGGGLYTYEWADGLGTDQSIDVSPTETTTYTVFVEDNCGSSSAVGTVTVTVDDGPSVSAGFDIQVCEGGSVVLNASTDTPGSTYSWDPPTGMSNSNILNPLVTPVADQEYTLTVTRNDGCSNTDAVMVTLGPPPTPEFIIPEIGCVGKPVIVTYSGTANQSAQFQWVFPNGTVTNGNGIGPIAVMWQDPGVYDAELTVAWGGCVSTTETRQIEILDVPPVDAGPDLTICPDETLNVGTPAISGLTYSWTPTNLVIMADSAQTEAIGVNTEHEPVVLPLVLTTSYQGCTSTDTVFLTVLPKPVAEFTVPHGKCFNVNSFSLEAGGYFGLNATFWWDFGSVGYPANSTDKDPQGFIFNAPGAQDVSLVITDNGCVSDTFVAAIDVYEMPEADFAVDTAEGCEPFGVKFQDLSYNGGSSLYYDWTLGNGLEVDDAEPGLIYMEGTYDIGLKVTTAKGCADSIMRNQYLVVHPKPEAYFALDSTDVDILFPKVTATNLTPNIDSSLFRFDPFDVELEGEKVSYVFPDTGLYNVRQIVTTEFGCKDTLVIVAEVHPHYTFYIPNAFTPDNNGDNDIWMPQGESIASYELYIFNRWDQQVFQSVNIEHGWDGRFNGSNVPPGIYTYKIRVYDILGEPHNYVGTFTLFR